MRRCSYNSVADRVEALWTASYNQRGPADDNTLNQLINRWAQEFWESAFWPEWTIVEKRQFRPSWLAATAYTVTTEVYYPPEEAYYQSVKAGTGQLPNATDSAYWAECSSGYEGEDWVTGTAYVVADVVRNPLTDLFYYCNTAHTAAALFSTDAAKWGVLTPFLRSIDYEATGETAIGEIKALWDAHPYIYPASDKIEFHLTDEIVVAGSQPFVYAEFRERCPDWTGTEWASGAYAVGAQVYYAGDYYRCIATVTAEAPTDTSKWTRIDFPYTLREATATGAFSELLRGLKEFDRANLEEARARAMNSRAIQQHELRQAQAGRLPVRSR